MYTETYSQTYTCTAPQHKGLHMSCWPAHPSGLQVCPLQLMNDFPLHPRPHTRQVLLQLLTTFLYCICHSFGHPVIPSLWHGPLVSLMSIEQVCKRRDSHPLVCLHTLGREKPEAGSGSHLTLGSSLCSLDRNDQCKCEKQESVNGRYLQAPCLVLALAQPSKRRRWRST